MTAYVGGHRPPLSERVLQCELQDPRIQCGSNPAEVRTDETGNRVSKPGVIQDVEPFNTQLENLSFLEREFSRQAHIDIPRARSSHAVAAGIAVCTGPICNECSRVEPLVRRRVGQDRITNLIRALIGVSIKRIVPATGDA